MSAHEDALPSVPSARPARADAGATNAPGAHEEGPAAAAAAALGAARRQAVPLALWMIACLVAAAWYLHVTPPSYTATATVILDPRAPAQAVGEGAQPLLQSVLDSAQAESQIQVIRSERLLSTVFDALGLADSPELLPSGGPGPVAAALRKLFGVVPTPHPDAEVSRAVAFANFAARVGTRRVGQSYVIEVSYTSDDPAVTFRYANAIVSAYLGQQVASKADAAANGAEFRQGRVDALATELKVASDAVAAGRLPSAALPDADARVIGAALRPLGKSAPKSGLVIAFAAALGLLSGLFVVAVRNGFDHRIRTPEQLWRETGLECLGTLPEATRRIGFARGATKSAIVDFRPDGRFAVAVRDLRTSIALGLGHGARSVAVASWSHGAGRSMVASNLARTMAASGTVVTLVDAEVQRTAGGLTGHVGAEAAAGLGDQLMSDLPVADVSRTALGDHLSFVASHGHGRTVDPRAYLGSPRMGEVLTVLSMAGSVVVDLPALGTSPDARAVGGLVDGVVLVVDARRTTRAEVSQALRALAASHANVLGAVLNRVG